jgi:pSer/pThr/pTyr-binding forkhead associated (FHA) protein
MRNERADGPVAGRPALVITYGNTTRKCRPLDRDILVLGRAPGCDIAPVSPEVAPVHCLIVRGGDGWRIRDCSAGRPGTRVNGRAVHEELLHDADTLQVGRFSFEVHLPDGGLAPGVTPSPGRPAPSAALVRRLERSRRHLVRLALALRRRAHKAGRLPPMLAELEQQAECLRGLQRECETQ